MSQIYQHVARALRKITEEHVSLRASLNITPISSKKATYAILSKLLPHRKTIEEHLYSIWSACYDVS
jgi:hypothetical protein